MADAPTQDPYEVARQRAAAKNNAAVQDQQDAIQRRFAANGSLNSGAAIKQQQLAAQAGQQNLADQTQAIDAAQNQENLRLKEAKANRDFTTSERLGSEGFAAQQAGLGRQFQTSERLGSQDYGAQQAAAQRQFQTGERVGGENFAASQNALQRQQQADQFNKQFDFSKEQYGNDQWYKEQNLNLAKEQFQADKDTTAFNEDMARKMADLPNNGVIGSILGDNGIFGVTKSILGNSGGGVVGKVLGI